MNLRRPRQDACQRDYPINRVRARICYQSRPSDDASLCPFKICNSALPRLDRTHSILLVTNMRSVVLIFIYQR